MIPLLVALALAAQPANAVAVSDDQAPDLAGMQEVYEQSCAAREFGAYDDMCDQLKRQINAALAKADRDARETARKSRPVAKPPNAAPAASPKPPAG